MNKKTFVLAIMLLSGGLSELSLHAQTTSALRDSLKKAVELLEYHPQDVDLRLRKAAWNLLLEQWQYAKDEYDLILKNHPDNIAGLYYRGYANQKLGRHNFARLDYENLLKIVPGHFSGLLGLAYQSSPLDL